jgi:3D (Asp-Asp-Asp) domain-containing protein
MKGETMNDQKKFIQAWSLIGILMLALMHPTIASASGDSAGTANEENASVQSEKVDTAAQPEEEVDLPDIAGHWAAKDLEAMEAIGALHQKPDGTYGPDQPITRAEFIHMATVTKGFYPELVPSYSQTYADVPKDYWAFKAIELAHRTEVAEGMTKKRFEPDATISREQAFSIINRLMGQSDEAKSLSARAYTMLLSRYHDGLEVSNWAKRDVAYALKKELINGFPDRTLQPQAALTKAEAAVLVNQTLNQMRQTLKQATVNGKTLFFKEKMSATVTAYNSNEPGLSNRTATGALVHEGVIAVDPSVIPYGTHLYVEGYGFGVAADRGGSIKNNKLDVYVANYQKAMQFGSKSGVNVYILD